MITAQEAKEEMKRNLVKYDYDYDKIKELAQIIHSLGRGIESSVLSGEKEKDVEYDFYKWRLNISSLMEIMDESLDDLFEELHLEFFRER